MLISSVLLLLFFFVFVFVFFLFFHMKPLKGTVNPGLKQARKNYWKYEVHEKTSCWQKQKREVTLTGFNIFPKGTDIVYVSSNYR